MDDRSLIMRVGLTVESLSPQLTGIGNYTWQLCCGMAAHEAISDIRYFRFGRWVSHPGHYISNRRVRGSLVPLFIRRWQSGREFGGRLIHGTNYFLPDQTERGVITVHDMSVFLHPDTHPLERVKAFERDFMRSLQRAEHVITDSEATRKDFITLCGYPDDRVTAIHLGVSKQFTPLPRCQIDQALALIFGRVIGDYVLSVATFEPRKRIEAAIRSHSLFCDRTGQDIPLVLVGATGWGNDGIHRLIDAERSKGRIIMLGYVSDKQLPVIYAGAKLFLYPSIYEGFGLPPIEAMACGVPTIVSDRSCLPEVTRGAALMVNPDDLDTLSRAIEQGLDDDNWRAKAIESGLEVAAHYDWSRCIERTVGVYNKCIDAGV
ncbi:glycosyltransferase family 4 protein [Sphingobium algorifonticola]|uniref:Glycosyltransferase family 1 protein n=1 Tax=Sphingobium algorifonticola TaxID=2008318 RepID=A0A437J768_9SPHN|nr:glycosyltransferase family 1 protein [Sphingobium algorifonticola]RVT41021.1 glycosyltransferase family 1 protein [Sphingobium algorifonticola]